MGPLQPVANDVAGQAGYVSWTSSVQQSSAVLISSTELTGAAQPADLGQALAASRVTGEVARMLQSVGGGVENNDLLKLLIAAMILLALLNESDAPQPQSQGALQGLGGGSADRAAYVGIFSSSSSVVLQQTTMSYGAVMVDSYAPSPAPPAEAGGQINFTA